MFNYSKAVLQVLATVASGIVAYLVNGNGITPTQWVNVAILGVGSLMVFVAPNVPGAAFTKSLVAALTAGLTVLASAIVGGITYVEWLQIGIAVLGALGVFGFKNNTTRRV